MKSRQNFPVEIKGLFTDDKVGDFSGVGFPWKVDLIYIIGNFKNPLVSREQLTTKSFK